MAELELQTLLRILLIKPKGFQFMKTYFVLLSFLLCGFLHADDFTEFFGNGDARDLASPTVGQSVGFGVQLVFTPNETFTDYTVCRSLVPVLPVFPFEIQKIAGEVPNDPPSIFTNGDVFRVADLPDESSQQVSLPAGEEFTFFGVAYSSLYINDNGNITFAAADPNSLGGDLAQHFAQPRISGAFTDLWANNEVPLEIQGFVGWGVEDDRLVILYTDNPVDKKPNHQNVDDLVSFSIEIWFKGEKNGQIRITYDDEVPDTVDFVAGLSDGQGAPTPFSESDLSTYPLCDPASALSISPSASFSSSGITAQAGSFSPVSETYTLTNMDAIPLTWTLTDDADLVSVNKTTGTLAPGASEDLIVQLDTTEAAARSSGTYNESLPISSVHGNIGAITIQVDVAASAPIVEIVEEFTGGSDAVDLGNISICYEYNNSLPGYEARIQTAIQDLPVDPQGGTLLVLGDDSHVQVTLPNAKQVRLFGQNYSSFYVNSNGWVTFNSGNASAFPLLNGFLSAPAVAALLDDLDPSVAGAKLSWKELPDRIVVTFEDVPEFGEVSVSTFQIELYTDDSARVVVSYLGLSSQDGIAGISSGSGYNESTFAETDLSQSPLKPEAEDELDFGDLPNAVTELGTGGYPTQIVDGGPSHVIVAGVHLGAAIDAETDGLPSDDARGDDIDAAANDEDGVELLHPFVAGKTSELQITASVPGYLNAWIDWNGNGDLSDAGDQVAQDLPLQPGPNILQVQAPAGFSQAVTYARFRFTNNNPLSELGFVGPWDNGEVEDYAWGSIQGTVWFDDGNGVGIEGNGQRDEAPVNILEGIEVYLQRPGGVPVTDALGAPVMTLSDATGQYRFEGLPPGDYELYFEIGGLPVSPPDVPPDDSIDNDVAPNGTTTSSVIVNPGQVVQFVDLGLLPVEIQFSSLISSPVTEEERDAAIIYALDLPLPLPLPLSFEVQYSGSATSTSDYDVNIPGMITIPAGSPNQVELNFFDLLEDNLYELDEDVILTLVNPSYGRIGTRNQVRTIIENDDPLPVLSISSVSVNEGDGTVDFTISLSAVSGVDASFSIQSFADTADEDTGSGGDFLGAQGMRTITAGSTSTTFTVTIQDDTLDEDDEQFRVELSSAGNASIHPSQGAATGTIVDDDEPPILSLDDASLLEGAAATMDFVLRLDRVSGRDVQVVLKTVDDSAASPQDYTEVTMASVTLPKGSLQQSFSVTIKDDNLMEGEERFQVLEGQASNGTYAGTPIGVGRIFDKPTILSNRKFAWGSTSGWQNWNASPVTGIVVGDSFLSGYIWCSTTGWIHLGDGTPDQGQAYSNSSATDYGVNLAKDGKLTGYGWSATTGWVSFEQTHGLPRINRLTGVFSGYAWSATLGWINLGSEMNPLLQTGTLAMVDMDGDGIEDGYEIETFGDLTTADGTTDTDGDGVNDIDESFSGTDADDATDFLKVSTVAMSGQGSGFQLSFPTKTGLRYSIEHITDLRPPTNWMDSGLGIFDPDPSGTTTKTIPFDPMKPTRFFRIVPHQL